MGLGLLAHMAPGMGWTNGDVEKGMPAPLAERFAADRKALGYPVARYATPAPAFAAFKLQHDYLEKAGLGEDLGPRLTREARRSGVTVERPVRVDAAPLRLEEISLDRPPIRDCFQALLGEVETDPQLYRTAAASWAAGRLDGFWEFGLQPWDIAAGILLIREAGGRVTDIAGGHDMMTTGNI